MAAKRAKIKLAPEFDLEVHSLIKKEDGVFCELLTSAYRGDVTRVKSCLERGDDVNMVECGATALSMAIMKSHNDVIEYLLTRPEVDLGRSLNQSRSTLCQAVRYGNAKLVRNLLDNFPHKIAFHDVDIFGHTALSRYCFQERFDVF